MSDPWALWIPGVLSKRQVGELITQRYILNTSTKLGDLDYSSLDLRVGDNAYELTGGSVKPFASRYLTTLLDQHLAVPVEPTSSGYYFLQRRKSYLFTIMEQIPGLMRSPIHGAATAKSSVGRVDVLARLIVDGMDEYEGFIPSKIFNGSMFLEVTPMTFNVCIRPGTALTQLRLFKGPKDNSIFQGKALLETVFNCGPENEDATLSVDLSPEVIAGNPVSVLCAPFDMQKPDSAIKLFPDAELARPWEHWKFVKADAHGRLRIEKDRFYIIRSHEKIHLPAGIAVYCRASDETIGEMRIHYAGFVHPFFGNQRSDGTRGTPLIFEVRGHDVVVSLRNREKMARLEFYRMSEDARDEGGGEANPYAGQSLTLSKFFAKWPVSADCSDDGTVTPK